MTLSNYGYIFIIDSNTGHITTIRTNKKKYMPNLDKTGPTGMGPGTGRKMGPCFGGAGQGFGRGFRCRRFFTKREESEILKEEAEMLEEELKAIKERLAEIESQK